MWASERLATLALFANHYTRVLYFEKTKIIRRFIKVLPELGCGFSS